MHKLFSLGTGLLLLFAATPSSSNYTLKDYDIGSGGGSSSSANYKVNGTVGSQSSASQSSASYGNKSGLQNGQTTNVPLAPTFTNPSSYYDRLKLVLNPGSDPADTKYLIAISSDGFVTTNYVQADHSVAASQAIANYQTYTAWGSSGGFTIVGLLPSTSYTVKLKAIRGTFTGSAYGPTAAAATVATSLTMSLATSLTGTPPFNVGFTSLTPGTVTSANATGIVGLTSNANNGGTVYVQSANAGLLSTLSGGSIPSATTDLGSAASGYGAQVTATSQTSGGPLVIQSPFTASGTNVGGLSTTLQPLLVTTAPINGSSSTVSLKAKASSTTPSASDYKDTLTFLIAMNY